MTDPFSGISHDFNAERSFANQMRDHGNTIRDHGNRLDTNTQGKVGSGPLGEVADGFVKRITGAFAKGFSGALHGFYHDTATLAERGAGKFENIEADTVDRHKSIGPKGGWDSPSDIGGRLGAAVNNNVDASAVTPQPVKWWGGSTTWRSDNRSPSDIFKDGFGPKDPSNHDLLDYVHHNTPSAFVSTTDNPALYQTWGSKYVYTVKAPPGTGIDVNDTLGEVIKPGEDEVAFLGGIKPQYIQGGNNVMSTDPILSTHGVMSAGTLGEGLDHPPLPPNLKGKWTPNPHFKL